ncbi:MAG: hypothetical protein MHPSP_001443 [Paramarteilia canceri]
MAETSQHENSLQIGDEYQVEERKVCTFCSRKFIESTLESKEAQGWTLDYFNVQDA